MKSLMKELWNAFWTGVKETPRMYFMPITYPIKLLYKWWKKV